MEHPVTAARAPTAARPGGSSTVAARLVKGPPRDGNRVRSKQPPGRVPEPLTVSPATISAMARSAPALLGTAHLGRSTPPGRVLVRHLTIGFTGLGGRRRRTLSPGTCEETRESAAMVGRFERRPPVSPRVRGLLNPLRHAF